MKDAILTVRVPRATRRRIEALARREGRSLSQQVERLVTRAMEMDEDETMPKRPPGKLRPLRGIFEGRGPVPGITDFRAVRRLLSSSLLRRVSRHDFDRR